MKGDGTVDVQNQGSAIGTDSGSSLNMNAHGEVVSNILKNSML